jgi:hypothetical protein
LSWREGGGEEGGEGVKEKEKEELLCLLHDCTTY